MNLSLGAGVAIELLLSNKVDRIILNDYDIAIYSFGNAVLTEAERLIEKIEHIPIDLSVWHEQRRIYNKLRANQHYDFDLAFATFFLNRTNRAGIITGDPIGGFEQKSRYPIDCRFNKVNILPLNA